MNTRQRMLTFLLATVMLVGFVGLADAEPGPQKDNKPADKPEEKKAAKEDVKYTKTELGWVRERKPTDPAPPPVISEKRKN